jgi:hypothetical protein
MTRHALFPLRNTFIGKKDQIKKVQRRAWVEGEDVRTMRSSGTNCTDIAGASRLETLTVGATPVAALVGA